MVCNLTVDGADVGLDTVPRELLLTNGRPKFTGTTVSMPGESFAVLRV